MNATVVMGLAVGLIVIAGVTGYLLGRMHKSTVSLSRAGLVVYRGIQHTHGPKHPCRPLCAPLFVDPLTGSSFVIREDLTIDEGLQRVDQRYSAAAAEPAGQGA